MTEIFHQFVQQWRAEADEIEAQAPSAIDPQRFHAAAAAKRECADELEQVLAAPQSQDEPYWFITCKPSAVFAAPVLPELCDCCERPIQGASITLCSECVSKGMRHGATQQEMSS